MAPNPATLAHGPMLIGLLFNTCLYGIMIAQCYYYWLTSRNDKTWIKVYVFVLFLADTLNSVFNSLALYGSLITHFGDMKYLARTNWLYSSDAAMTAIIAALVQAFFAWRVKALTSNTWFALAIVFCAATSFLGGIGTSIAVYYVPLFADAQKFKVPVSVWIVSNVVGDIIVTTILVWHLTRRKTGFAATDDIVNRIIKLTIQTGLITSICAVADLTVYLAIPTGLHLLFNFTLAKLYSNSMMSTLNARAAWKGGDTVSTFNANSPPMDFMSKKSKGTKTDSTPGAGGPEVFVHVESHEIREWNRKKSGVDLEDGVDVKQELRLEFGKSHSDVDVRDSV